MDNDGDAVCFVEGNDDLYGLGIRLGVYCSLLATLFAKYFLPAALKGTMTTNAVFIFAITIAVVKNAASGDLATIEGFVMLQILFGYVLCGAEAGSTSLWIVSLFVADLSAEDQELVLAHVGHTELAMNFINILRTAIGSINVWFWFVGADRLRDGYLPCTFQIFFFRQFSGYGPIRMLFKVAALVYLSFQVLRHASGVLTSFQSFWKFRISLREGQDLSIMSASREAGQPFTIVLLWATTLNKQEESFRHMRKLSGDPYNVPAILMLMIYRMSERYETLGVRSRVNIRRLMRAYRLALIARDYLVMAWTALVIEMSLFWSGVRDVNSVDSTGQLVPLVIGLTSLVPIANESWKVTIEKFRRLAGHENINKDASTGHWRYQLRNGRTIQFPDNRILRRRSFEHFSFNVNSEQVQATDGPGDEVTDQKLLNAPPIFQPTGFGNEFRGPPLGETGAFPSWRRYFALQNGTIQVFSDSRPHSSVSCPDLTNTGRNTFQPWRFRPLWRGASQHPAMAREYRLDRLPNSSETSSSSRSVASHFTYQSIYGAVASVDEGSESWLKRLLRDNQVFAADRSGTRCAQNVKVVNDTARWFYRIQETQDALIVPCDFDELLDSRWPQRRWSTVDLNDVEDYLDHSDRRPPVIRDLLFTPDAVLAREYDKNLRKPPWSTKKVICFWTSATFLMMLFLLGTPIFTNIYIFYCLGTAKDSESMQSTIFRAISQYLPTAWQWSQTVAHGILLPEFKERRSRILEYAPVIITTVPSLISLLCIGFPVLLALELGHSFKELRLRSKLPEQARPPISSLTTAIFLFVIIFFPAGFFLACLFVFLRAIFVGMRDAWNEPSVTKTRKFLIFICVVFSPVWIFLSPVWAPVFIFMGLRRLNARGRWLEAEDLDV